MDAQAQGGCTEAVLKESGQDTGAADSVDVERRALSGGSPSLGRTPRSTGATEVRAWLLTQDSLSQLTIEDAARRIRGTPVPGELVLVDMLRPGDGEATIMREQMKLHPLAVEDVMRGRQRPKLERYPRHYFVVFYGAAMNRERRRVAFRELHVFIGPHFMVAASHHRISEVHELVAHCRRYPAQMKTSGALVHWLLDAVVDDYFPIVHDFSEKVTRLENDTITGAASPQDHLVSIRRELILFRRVVAPERDVVGTALRRDIVVLEPELTPYFQDLRDHLERLTEEIDTLRELLSTVVEARNSALSNSLNQTIRIMTAWSIILMSITVVAGVYGMNFRYMPETQWRFGYLFAVALMLALGLGLFTYFRRRDWI
ncbi:MAG: magnesium transporter CorA family protein [Longimicrobiales bacterium]